MRLKEFAVFGLFGVFDHRICLNDKDRITVLYGPNGFGKTTVLRLLRLLLSGDYIGLLEVPFSRLELSVESGRQLVLQRSATDDPEASTLDVSLWIRGKRVEGPFQPLRDITRRMNTVWKRGNPTGRELREAQHLRNLLVHMPSPASSERFVAPETSAQLFWLQSFIQRERENIDPDWLTSLKKDFPPARLVDTERLTVVRREEQGKGGAVDDHASHLAGLIKQELARYAERSQALDRSFPARLLEALGRRKRPTDGAPEALRVSLDSLEEKRATLRGLGLLEEPGASPLTAAGFERVGSSIETVLSIYIDDNKEKLSVLEPILQKVALLSNIVNDRFLFKSLRIDKEKGFIINKAAGGTLPLQKLSSGEQHELVLLSELLFHVEPNSLILIDEPEISLNVAWQVNFLRDLGRIQELIPLDVVVATHSPQIVHDRWDLTVELKGPNSGHAEEARH